MDAVETAMANLSDLAKVSQQLNEESNQVNQILADLEKNLVEMNLGVEAWVTNEPLTSRRYVEENDLGEKTGNFSYDEVLGFGRHNDRFCLLTRSVVWKQDAHEEWEVEHEGSPRPLLQSSRELRVKALDQLELLINALLAEGRRVLDSIKKGKETVEKIQGPRETAEGDLQNINWAQEIAKAREDAKARRQGKGSKRNRKTD